MVTSGVTMNELMFKDCLIADPRMPERTSSRCLTLVQKLHMFSHAEEIVYSDAELRVRLSGKFLIVI
jgi:hypothetical protein